MNNEYVIIHQDICCHSSWGLCKTLLVKSTFFYSEGFVSLISVILFALMLLGWVLTRSLNLMHTPRITGARMLLAFSKYICKHRFLCIWVFIHTPFPWLFWSNVYTAVKKKQREETNFQVSKQKTNKRNQSTHSSLALILSSF